MAFLSVSGHGAGCCGVRHVSGLSPFKKKDAIRLKKIVDEHNKPHNFRKNSCTLLEAIVTDNQLALNPALKGGLKEAGFRCVSRFKNRNSGRICYVYHNYTKV